MVIGCLGCGGSLGDRWLCRYPPGCSLELGVEFVVALGEEEEEQLLPYCTFGWFVCVYLTVELTD